MKEFRKLGNVGANDWIHGIIPWWNPYSGIGMPMAGEMQPGSFFLPFILLLLLKNGILWLKISLEILAGLTTFILLRKLGLEIFSSTIGGILYQLNGTFAWVPGAESVIGSIPFLPLLLYGIECSRSTSQNKKGSIWIAIAIAFFILSGFPEVSYISGLLGLLWFLVRILDSENKFLFIRGVLYGGVLGLLITLPLLVAFGDYLFFSDAFTTHIYGNAHAPWPMLSKILFPYTYGPIQYTFRNIRLAGIADMSGGYISILLLFFSVIGLTGSRNKKIKLILFIWILLSFSKTFGIPLISDIINNLPFLMQTGFYRYAAPSWELSVIILCSFAISELLNKSKAVIVYSFIFVLIITFISWNMASPWNKTWDWHGLYLKSISYYAMVSFTWGILSILISSIFIMFYRPYGIKISSYLLVVEAFVMFSIPELSGVHQGKIDREVIQFLKNNIGFERVYSLGPIQPNYGAYFNIPFLNFSSLPIPKNFKEYVINNIYPELEETGFILLWPPAYNKTLGINNLYKNINSYKKLGVKYILSSYNEDMRPSIFLHPKNDLATSTVILNPGKRLNAIITTPITQNFFTDQIYGIGIKIGNFNNSSDGNINVNLCSANTCVSGIRSMAESKDSNFIFIPFNKGLRINPSEKLKLKIIHNEGTIPFVLWLFPSAKKNQLINIKNKFTNKFDLNIILVYGLRNTIGINRVYSDKYVNVWKLSDYAPYFSLKNKNDCILNVLDRSKVYTDCQSQTVLIRHELYMPGWKASLNSRFFNVLPYESIFQSIRIPAGKQIIIFSYQPPFIFWGWVGCMFGFFCISIEIWLLTRQNRVKVFQPPPSQ